MTKSKAIEIFGSVYELAHALEITPHAIYQWPEEIKEPRASQIKLLALQKVNPKLFTASESLIPCPSATTTHPPR